MARITVEDCLENVDNRFNLVLIAAKRARQLSEGHQSELEIENDKNTVLALREIAAGLVNSDILIDEPEPEETAERLTNTQSRIRLLASKLFASRQMIRGYQFFVFLKIYAKVNKL